MTRLPCLLLFLLLAVSGIAQQYTIKNYSVKDGVAQSQVWALHQDQRGLLWMGTRGGGLSCFDGSKFITFTQKDSLLSNYISCLTEDSEGNLWIGTDEGLCRYDGRSFRTYQPRNNDLRIFDFCFDQRARLWLATSQGVWLFDSSGFTDISSLYRGSTLLINCIENDPAGRIWFGDALGLSCISPQKKGFSIKRMEKIRPGLNTSIHAIAPRKEGGFWIGTYGNGLYIFEGGRFIRVKSDEFLDRQTIFHLLFDEEKSVLHLATLENGLISLDLPGGNYNVLNESRGLSNNHVRHLLKDRSGNLWIGTSGGGVGHYFGKEFTTFDKTSGLAGNFIYSIYKDSRGRLIMGTSNKGITVLDSGRFTNYAAGYHFADVKVKCLLEIQPDYFLLGTEGNGVYTWDGDSTFEQVKGMEEKYIRYLLNAKNGKTYIATAGHGILVFQSKDRTFRSIGIAQGLPGSRVNALYEDRKGRIWIALENEGIALMEGNTISQPLDEKYRQTVRCLTEDEQGRLWAGTAGSGLWAIDMFDPLFKVQTYSYGEGLSSGNIYLLTYGNGYLYAGSENGLDRLRVNEAGEIEQIKHFGKGEGFSGIETCQNAVLNENNGTFWFGTINGLIRYIPARQWKNTVPPVLRLTDIRLFYTSLAKTEFSGFTKSWNQVDFIRFPFQKNHLTFDFQAINFSNPEAVKYQWKLEGFDADWSPAGNQNTVTYSNIPPGTYRFLVKAMNEDGVWTPDAVVYGFAIEPPWWMNPWILGTGSVTLVLLVLLVFRWRVNLIRKKAGEAQKKAEMEKELLELEQKALRLQMNPHFIFNALNSIQSQIGTHNEQNARYYLAKFSRLMRQILDNSRSSQISLQEEVHTLENYLLIEKFCHDNRFDYEVRVQEDLPLEDILLPPMLLQPFIENAIKHGLRYLQERPGKIEVVIHENNGLLECIVQDNGIGRKKSAELNREGKESYHRSSAMEITSQRLQQLSLPEGVPALEIIDLTNESGEGCGTRIILRIALNYE